MYGATLITLLIVLGGVIAYTGDWVGRRVGRQRLTLFGLRPKHTSVVIAVVTGVMVVGTTLATLIIADNDFREMLIDYGSVKTELVATQGTLSSTQQKLKDVEGQLDSKLVELDQKERQISDLEAKVQPLTEQIDALNRQIVEKSQKNQELEQANAALGTRVAQLDQTVADKEKALGDAERNLGVAEERLKSVEQKYREAADNLVAAQEELSKTREDLERARDDRASAENDLAQATAQLDAAQDDLIDAQAELARVKGELETARAELEIKRSELGAARKQISGLGSQIDDLQAQSEALALERGVLEAERDALLIERDELRDERDQLQRDKDDLSKEVNALDQAVDALKNQVNSLENEIEALKGERESLRQEIEQLTKGLEQLSKDYVAATETFDLQYKQLLDGATQGRIMGVKGSLIANWVLSRGELGELDRYLAQLGRVVGEQWRKGFEVVHSDLDSVRAVLSNATDKVLVRVTLAENVYQEDKLTSTVRANLQVHPRRQLFERGEIIALSESPVDPRGKDRYYLMEALARVGEAAKRRALESGMYVSSDGTVGVDVSENVDSVVNQILGLSEPVRLYMKADEDVYNTDGPIDWSFGFRPESYWQEYIQPGL